MKINFPKKIAALSLTAALSISAGNAVYAFDTTLSDNNLILVNKEHPLDRNDKANDLVELDGSISKTKNSILMRQDAADAFLSMYQDMEKSGVEVSAVSGYRSFSYQTGLFSNEIDKQLASGKDYNSAYQKAGSVVAPPGNSEHQSGLALDVSGNGSLTEKFADTPAGKWLAENCWKYGFILRYQQEKKAVTDIIYEPWHFRYVGVPHAYYMHENNLALEEYIALLQKEGKLAVKVHDNIFDIYYTADTSKEYDNIVSISSDNTGGYIITCSAASQKETEKEEADKPMVLPLEKVSSEEKPADREEGKKIGTAQEQETKAVTEPAEQKKEAAALEDNKKTEEKTSSVALILPDEKITKTAFIQLVEDKTGAIILNAAGIPKDELITRQEAIRILSPLVDSDKLKWVHFQDMEDISISCIQDIQKFYALGLIIDNGDTMFYPNEEITASEANKLIYSVNNYNSAQK